MKRFIVKLGSETGHCCFEATVIDTGVESRYGNVCECLCEEDAQHIAKALNDYAEAIEKEGVDAT